VCGVDCDYLYTVGMHPAHQELLVLDVPHAKIQACAGVISTLIENARAGKMLRGNQFCGSVASPSEPDPLHLAIEAPTEAERVGYHQTHACKANNDARLLLIKPAFVDRCNKRYAASWGSQRLASLMANPAGVMTLPPSCESIMFRVQRQRAGDPPLPLRDDDCYVELRGQGIDATSSMCRKLPSGRILSIDAGNMLRGGLGTLHIDFDCSNNRITNLKLVDEYAARKILMNYVEGVGHGPITFGMWPDIEHVITTQL